MPKGKEDANPSRRSVKSCLDYLWMNASTKGTSCLPENTSPKKFVEDILAGNPSGKKHFNFIVQIAVGMVYDNK